MRDQIIFHVPDWVMVVVAIWLSLRSVEIAMDLYQVYLHRKMDRIRREVDRKTVGRQGGK